MSLYNNISATVSLLNAASSVVSSAISSATSALSSTLSSSVSSSTLSTAASILAALPSAVKGITAQVRYWGGDTPLYGGISPANAKTIYDQFRQETLAKKNLWLLEVSSDLNYGVWDKTDKFNFFATELSFEPYIVQGDKVQVGGAQIDLVNGTGAVEMSITTMDDTAGTLKRWFSAHQAAAVAQDGTVGEPGKYAIKIRVVHSFIADSSSAYEDIGLFRPENLSVSLSRADDGIEELQMTFSQLDTFMAVY